MAAATHQGTPTWRDGVLCPGRVPKAPMAPKTLPIIWPWAGQNCGLAGDRDFAPPSRSDPAPGAFQFTVFLRSLPAHNESVDRSDIFRAEIVRREGRHRAESAAITEQDDECQSRQRCEARN